MKSYATWISALAIVGLITSGSPENPLSPATANASPAQSLAAQSQSIADITEQIMPSVVSISIRTKARLRRNFHQHSFGDPFSFGTPKSGRGVGSGVIVSKSGYILTNNHVVENAETIRVVLHSGKKVTAKVVGTDSASDLAVLKIKGKISGLKPLVFGDSNRLRLGEIVLAMGNPLGVGKSVTMGIVSALDRAVGQHDNFIQTDAAINPGNSGGALVNLQGELVGINTAIISRTGGNQGIGFAIPSESVRPIMKSLIATGKVERGWLGVGFQDITTDLVEALGLDAKRGALITDVMPGSPADKGGLRRDDIVVEINGRKIRTGLDFRNRIARAGSGKSIRIKVVRNGTKKSMSVKLGDRSSSLQAASHSPKSGNNGKQIGALGVRVASTSSNQARRFRLPRNLNGVVITNVAPDSRAAEIGLREGDVILAVNRRRVRSASDLGKAYKSSKRRVALRIWRDGMTNYMVLSK